MDSLKREAAELKNKYHEKEESVTEQVRDTVSDLYEQGKEQLSNLEGCVEEYTDEFLKKVKENPLTSILIAGGIGFIVSRFLKK
jgi:ElaB/YqjD/DUF883 family membrane-anchored ribosome-binding protein